MKQKKVCKFGGTSLATAEMIKQAADIIMSEKSREYIVVSAPGKKDPDDYKVTDLLYNLHLKRYNNVSGLGEEFELIDLNPNQILEEIRSIYSSISKGLNVDSSVVDSCMNELTSILQRDCTPSLDLIVSRGENFNARIISKYLSCPFIDSKDIIFFDEDGSAENLQTTKKIQALEFYTSKKVIPGFYGSILGHPDCIITFDRGGSDITGSIIASAIDADVYENWTDQSGVKRCNPNIFSESQRDSIETIPHMTYKEARELTYMGFKVFHDEAMGPVMKKKIPINIRNTKDKDHPGTWISDNYEDDKIIRGIAGKKDFCSITIEKYLMNKEIGFGEKLLNIFSKDDINYEHSPSGIDSISVILDQSQIKGSEQYILDNISRSLEPDSITMKKDISLIAVVGEGMVNHIGIASKVTSCLADEGINIEVLNQGASESNIIIGVDNKDYEKAIRSLYSGIYLDKETST